VLSLGSRCIKFTVLSPQPSRSPRPPRSQNPPKPLLGLRRALAEPFCGQFAVLSLALISPFGFPSKASEPSLVKISTAQIFPLALTRGEVCRPPSGAALVKTEGRRQIPTSCLITAVQLRSHLHLNALGNARAGSQAATELKAVSDTRVGRPSSQGLSREKHRVTLSHKNYSIEPWPPPATIPIIRAAKLLRRDCGIELWNLTHKMHSIEPAGGPAAQSWRIHPETLRSRSWTSAGASSSHPAYSLRY
jgi:hypothetical protein